jgi:CrcB protein
MAIGNFSVFLVPLPTLLVTGGIGLAGGLGALARYLLARFIAERVTSRYPLGTFLINVTGSFLIGLLFSLTSHALIPTTTQLILATGFLGGYTTFSTMSWESVQLARGGSTRASLFYLSSSLFIGLLAAYLGILAGGAI